jgi:general stress protein CsbA
MKIMELLGKKVDDRIMWVALPIMYVLLFLWIIGVQAVIYRDLGMYWLIGIDLVTVCVIILISAKKKLSAQKPSQVIKPADTVENSKKN